METIFAVVNTVAAVAGTVAELLGLVDLEDIILVAAVLGNAWLLILVAGF